jgi:hypothetical protein
MQTIFTAFALLRRLGQKFGPYVLIEILLPGGSLLALLLFLYRHGKLNFGTWLPLEPVPMSISRPVERL